MMIWRVQCRCYWMRQMLTKELGDKVQLVGDDLFVTNTERLKKESTTAAAMQVRSFFRKYYF